jgi:hypothetical protein
LRGLMGGLNGKASFATGEGRVQNAFARLLLSNLFGLLTPFDGDASRISCIAGNFDIKQGIAATRGTVVETPGATVVGAGNIDLRNERIDMRVDPKSKNLNLSAIAVPMRITGPLASPNVIPDPVATVGNTVNFATGTVNVATLGIFGALTGLDGSSDAAANPCATALNSALGAKPHKSTTEQVIEGVGGTAQDIGEGAVDVLQADATRCGGITGFLRVGALCEARPLPLSAHCGPSLHAHPCCAVTPVRHVEYFHDHVRIEHMLFDGALTPVKGALHPDLSRPGLGLDFKRADAQRYAV